MNARRIACIGGGNIAETHAAVLRDLGCGIAAVVEPLAARAADFAKKWNIAKVYPTVDALIAAGGIDVAHVLVPPPQHLPAAAPLLRAGIAVLLEKPMGQSVGECEALQQAASAAGAALSVNHNAVHYPAHRGVLRLIAANRIGPVRHVGVTFNLPLRQLGARQLGHWMFDAPVNLLLEQAVHPLSQIDDLVGPITRVAALVPAPLRLGEGQEVHRRWLVSFQCERGTAQLHLSLGETFPVWGATVIGDDGVITADYLGNRVSCAASGRAMDLFDSFVNGSRMATAGQWQSLANLGGAVAAMLKLRPRADVFYRSMRASIEGFYRDLDTRTADLTGALGRRMVEVCERIAAAAVSSGPRAAPVALPAAAPHEVLVVGGTGFIGTAVVRALLAQGRRVGVLARNTRNLPDLFADPRLRLMAGDARRAEDIGAAIGDAKLVINLAHGGGGGSRAEIERSLVGAARTVAEACLDRGVRRLVFVSSIASLYLGDPAAVVTGATPPDLEAEQRADYARAKALAERALIELRRTRGLPVVILRPGIVVGDGASPFHSGIGFYNHENHCLGWNRGTNPLPLVLAGDVADAIVRALMADGVEGKAYNIVGDVRLSARDYVGELARATGRDLHFHPQSVHKLFVIEAMKIVVKRLTGRPEPWPSLRDLQSRGLVAVFDCSDAMRDLGWTPVRDRAAFIRQGIACHGAAG